MSNDKHACDNDSQGTEYHLDFLEAIEKELDQTPLSVEQQRSATVLQSRNKLRDIKSREMSKPTLALKKSANSQRIGKAPRRGLANLDRTRRQHARPVIGSQPNSSHRYNMVYNATGTS